MRSQKDRMNADNVLFPDPVEAGTPVAVLAEVLKNSGDGGRGTGEACEGSGIRSEAVGRSSGSLLQLMADTFWAMAGVMRGRIRLYPGDLARHLWAMGYRSVPILLTILFLVGLTISLTSAETLRQFGADIYLVHLVGIGMMRELVPLMSGIILAGKVGASMTAEIAAMEVLEENDALRVMGHDPVAFLMVPRLAAMILVMPLLIVLSDLVGIGGGALVARVALGIPLGVFYRELLTVIGPGDFCIGLCKGWIFAFLMVMAAGYHGFSTERSGLGVGRATTRSVVLSISLVIGADCLIALLIY